jgi:diguanylate cyclase (GGDEF)-like protein/PAS domain S-box-containing protein
VEGRVVGHVGTVSDITERMRAERALRTLSAIFDSTTDFVVQLDGKGRLTYMNPAARRRTGMALDAPIEHLTMADFNPPQALARLMSEIVPTAVANGVWVGESQVWDAEHREFPVSHMVIAHRDKYGKVEYFSALMRDISAAKATEQALQESEARLRTVADALPMRVAYIDADERYRFNNLAYERGFGLSREQIQGRSVRELLGESGYRSAEPHIRAALSGKAVTFQSEMTSSDSYVCYEAHYIPQFAADGSTVLGFHAVVGDITRQKLEEKRLVELARIDTLTGVINRAGFGLRLAEVMGRCRTTGTLMALMYLDIDRFKQINDRFGHSVGDALLKAFAARLSQTLRGSDTVARLGGDEFTVIMESVPRPEVAGTVAAKVIQAMNTPFVIEQQTISVTTSIGLAFFQGGSMSAEALVKQADEMLYQAKGAGRNNVQAAPLALRLIEGGQA